MEKFEKLKKFRDLDSLKLINKDKSTKKLIDKFEDLQDIYTLITTYIKNNSKNWIYSHKDEVYYIFSENKLATRTMTKGSIEEKVDKIKKISNNFKDYNIEFNIPTKNIMEKFQTIGFLEDGRWYYVSSINNGHISYDSCRWSSSYPTDNILGICSIDDFKDSLDIRNQSLKLKTNILKEIDKKISENGIEVKKYTDIDYFIKTLSEIGIFNEVDARNLLTKMQEEREEVSPKEFLKRYKATLLENERLKGFEVILNYNLLDKNIIKEEEEQIKFRNLVNLYKTYKDYISCMYIKDDTEDTVELIFNTDKIISSAENRDELFNGIEILYKNNDLKITKEEIYNDKNIFYFENGDTEIIYNPKSEEKISIYYFSNGDEEKRKYKNGVLSEESTYYFKNGDTEKRNTKNGILEGKSIYTYKNGDVEEREYINGVLEGKSTYTSTDGSTEIREYRNGVLQGEVVYQKDGHKRKYLYTDGRKEEMPKLKYYLSIDKERINIDDYRENRLLDPNVGHWDLKEEDKEELKELLGKDVYSRDPKLDINQGGIVGIDFGTKSTVVVYQKDRNNILPMRISGEELNKEARDTDYENPTVIEFRDLIKFKKDYDEEIGRPNTKWEDVTISHVAFRHLMEGTSEQFDSIISDIKQWTVNKNAKIEVIDKKGNKISLPPYLDLDENEENYIDPVEIYAYYIGSYINTMRNGIYLEYYLSFPVTYEKAVREKILKSFEKGIKKSLPIQIQEDEKLMKKFRVKHGSNEPAAYAVCALKKLKIEPKENEKIYYGVFDFGGGTTDFDFGIWKNSEDEDMFDYELEHFGAGGDIHLGGENILKELAYKVFSDNTSELRKRKIQYVRPEWCPELSGEEILVEYTREAKLNTRKLGEEKLRDIWEEKETERIDNVLVNLFNADGSLETGIDLKINEEELKALIKDKIEKGIKNFFIKMEDAFKDEDVKKVHIFLAGNSCRHSFVNEIFEKYVAEMKDKMELVIYDLKAIKEIDKENDSKITGKTGVAYGLIYSRKGGRIKVTNRDEKENVANEINFKFYLGNSKKDKFNPIITPNSNYGKYEFLGILTSDIFEIYYTSSPEAQTGTMEIGKDDPKIKRISLNEEYDEDERYRIYIKTITPDKISYAIVKKEEDIETKEILEEGEVFLD